VSEAIEEQPKRRETGPIQFGDDWPGIFIRGDEALGMAVYLEAFLNGLDFYRTAIERHIKLLKSCDIEALKAQEPCKTCGDTKVSGWDTSKNKPIWCPGCQGERLCLNCRGSGIVQIQLDGRPDVDGTCTYCKGTGKC